MSRIILSDDEDEFEEYENHPDEMQDEGEDEETGDNGARNVGGDDDEEDDEEGQDEYEKDGFIVDGDDEDEGLAEEEDREDSDVERQKKRRKKREEYALDDDDYALLEDNIGFHRPKESKKFKRLKKAKRDAVGDHSGFPDEEYIDGSGASGRTADERLERSLFSDVDGVQLEDQLEENEEAYISDEDEMADFIVNEDEDDVNEHGVRVRSKSYKKKKFRQAPGVSSSALQEAHEIFGDVEKFLELRKQVRDTGEWKERRLEDEFEPVILSEKYMTEKDGVIREIDIPERKQISDESIGLPKTDEISLDAESNWIYNQIASGAVHPCGGESKDLSVSKGKINKFLELQHVQKLDIPFISMYRKEDCASLLRDTGDLDIDNMNHPKSDETPKVKWHKVLWTIRDLDRKWRLLQKRKRALGSYYNNRFLEEKSRYDVSRLGLNKQLFDSIMKSLKEAETEREVDDVDAKFNLHFPAGEIGANEVQYKRPKRKSLYSICNKAGLWEVANKFGCSSEQFGMTLSLEKMRMDEVEDAKETPEEVASIFTCAMFESPQAVLKGARHMAAVEISFEPCVRKYVRSIFMENAVVSTTPTAEGNAAIDSFHQYAGVKWLREKPLSRFEDAQWLLIHKAEEEKFLQVTIKLPEKTLNKLISDCKEYYLSMGVSKSAQLWNEQRKSILQEAIFFYLIPSMGKEARSLLSSRSKSWLLGEYGKYLWNKVSVGPYQRKENNTSSDDEAAPRVMACCWGPGKPATAFVMLDSSGEVLDVLYAGSLTLRSQNANNQQRKKNDQQRVLKFMTDHQPHVVVLGAVNLSCTRLKEDIYEIIFKMVEENPRDVGHEMDGMSIVWGDESLPRLYENSRISSDQLPGQPGIVRRAAALGRYLQNPLAMVATLCGNGREILSWKHSSLEQFLTPDEKYEMVEQVMVEVTNQVGIDINLATDHEWLFSPLQFISGLGPRKAASLQRSLVRTGAVYTRKDFVTVHGLGKKVFINSVGFLRVRRSGLAASSSQFFDLLDDTRIHPESYGLAQELAKAVYEEDIRGEANYDDDVLEIAVEHVRDKPYLLKSINIEEYCREKNRENKKETIAGIVRELIHGFLDWRKRYEEPNQDDEFYMISGETEETLAQGRLVQATVRRVQAQRAICNLESGLTGMLTKEDFSDDWRDIAELSDSLNEGDILTCKIKSIQKNRYQVCLACKESEMRNNQYQHAQNLDPYYCEGRSLQSEQEKGRKEKKFSKKFFKPRMIVHPRFQNISADKAMELLSDKEPGESIIRPSSRGPNYLTLTLKIYDGVYAHKDIVEDGKDHKDITNLLRIGKTLKIGDDTFEDLDEVMDQYVDPLVSHLKAMLNYRKFRKGNKAESDELLRVEKAEYPMRIVYCFGISHEYPGTIILSYIRSTNPHHEYIALYPKGFKFRKKMFDNIDRLVAYFQKHINDPLHDSARSIKSVAAMVPMRSPTNDGLATGSGWSASGNDGGWEGKVADKERSFAPMGRTDYRHGGGRDGHPSGLPRPFDGRGQGRGSRGNNERQESGYNASPKWDSGSKGGSRGSSPGAKVQNSPGRGSFPGGWDSTGSGSGSGAGLGESDGARSNKGLGASGGGSGWDQPSDEGQENDGSGWGSGAKSAWDRGPKKSSVLSKGSSESGSGSGGGWNQGTDEDQGDGGTGWGSGSKSGWGSGPKKSSVVSKGSDGGGGWKQGSDEGQGGAGSGWGSDGHPSGRSRPFGERGRGRGSRGNSERQVSGFNFSPRWDSGSKGGSRGSSPGAKVQNSPGRGSFPGGWDSTGSGSGSGAGLGESDGARSNKGLGASGGGSGWDQPSDEGQENDGSGWGSGAKSAWDRGPKKSSVLSKGSSESGSGSGGGWNQGTDEDQGDGGTGWGSGSKSGWGSGPKKSSVVSKGSDGGGGWKQGSDEGQGGAGSGWGSDGHPSGRSRPFGERGRGRGSRGNSERQVSGFNFSPRWDSGSKGGSRGSSPGAKVQNSPGRGSFPGGWDSTGSGSGSGAGLGEIDVKRSDKGLGASGGSSGWDQQSDEGQGDGSSSWGRGVKSGWGSGPKKSFLSKGSGKPGSGGWGSDGRPSGPRPFGGRGQGQGFRGNSERHESGYKSSPRWNSGSKGGIDSRGNFPASKVQNSPGRGAFPSDKRSEKVSGASGGGGGGGGGWDQWSDKAQGGGGSGSDKDQGDGGSGWGSGAKSGWGSSPSGQSGW